jgi:hypothetical protein
MVLEPSPHRSQRPHHVTVPASDQVHRRGESVVGERLGAHRAEVGREQHHVHVDVEAILQCQTGAGDAFLGVHRQRESA